MGRQAAREVEELRNIDKVEEEFERAIEEESDAKRQSKAERIKRNLKKKIKKEKKKANEVAKPNKRLPEKKKKTEATKVPAVRIKDVDAGEKCRMPTSPKKRKVRKERKRW